MKIIYVGFPTFSIEDRIYNPITNEIEPFRNVYNVNTIKSSPVTEHDDGLDDWLISVKNQGHDELYIYEINDCPLVYHPHTFEVVRQKFIRYFSRKKPN